MSGGAGHIFDMINRLKGNSSLLKGKGYFKTREELLKISGKTIYEYKKATPEHLAQIRRELISQRKRAFIKNVITVFLSTIVAFLISSLLIYWFIFN